MNAIVTEGLSKQFRTKFAVNNLSMQVPVGSIYGFIGQNGAGKSTAQKLICGLLIPTNGKIELSGHPVTDAEERSKIGVLIENPGSFAGWTAYENLMLQALNIGLESPQEAVRETLKTVGLENTDKKKVKAFSLGMKQRLGIATALLGHPKTLVLDEPINGLDPEGIMEVRRVLLSLNREYGITILISSHILGELSKIATHYGIIKDGTMVKEISAEDLSRESKDYLCVKADGLQKAFALIKKSKEAACEMIDGEIRIYDCKDGAGVNKLLFDNGITASQICMHSLDLEEYFLRLMGGFSNVSVS